MPLMEVLRKTGGNVKIWKVQSRNLRKESVIREWKQGGEEILGAWTGNSFSICFAIPQRVIKHCVGLWKFVCLSVSFYSLSVHLWHVCRPGIHKSFSIFLWFMFGCFQIEGITPWHNTFPLTHRLMFNIQLCGVFWAQWDFTKGDRAFRCCQNSPCKYSTDSWDHWPTVNPLYFSMQMSTLKQINTLLVALQI